jgi:hypothetical protein
MASMTRGISMAAQADQRQVAKEITSAEIWTKAKQQGMLFIAVRFDVNAPTDGKIETDWESPDAAQTFLDRFADELEISSQYFTPTRKFRIRASPRG